jgi:hypothetical protein
VERIPTFEMPRTRNFAQTVLIEILFKEQTKRIAASIAIDRGYLQLLSLRRFGDVSIA